MKILLASSEIVPFAKTGGLADVAGALPRELEKLGHDVSVFMPAYECIGQSVEPIKVSDVRFGIPLGHHVEEGGLSKSKLPDSNVTIYFVEHAGFFRRSSLYAENGHDYFDNCERFIFFCRSVLESIRLLQLSPDVVHVNDWQTGLIPALLKCEYAENPVYQNMATLITIHNLAYQGIFEGEKMALTGLDGRYFNWQQMEFHGRLNLLKTGIVFADSINTVSPTYAREIQTPEQGCGLDPVLRQRAGRVSGILNGIDTADWNPETDPFLPANFDANFDLETGHPGKSECKRSLQVESKLPSRPDVPIIGIVGRLASQKGWSLILPILRAWLESVDAQWVILGTGDPDYHHVLTSLYRSHPDKLALTLGFSNALAHRIEAGADMFLMPSEYEPCGLNQMYSMAYGTIPIVRRTGGLADTVVNATQETIDNQTATGFSFEEFNPSALGSTMEKAIGMYQHNRHGWRQMMQTGMRHDWSWSASARRYEQLYRETMLCRSLSTGS